MIDTEHVKCDTCTAPEPMELDASDEASRGWPTVDIETNPYKGQFPLFQQHPEIAFLDSAATAQRPACVLDAERDFYQRMNANPLRGLYSLSVEATDAIAKVRQQTADLIGAAQANEVVFTRNTSESLNLVAKSFAPTVLEPGDEVVITIMEHHSNLIPWQQVCRETGAKLVYLYPTKTGQLTTEEVLAKVGPKTKILAVGQVSNVLGVENPVKNLGKLVHKYGGYLVVDGAQSLPHMPVNVADLGADFFAFSAHKAMGPMGIGVLWGKKKWLDAMPPFLFGGEMIQSVSREGAVYAEVPHKFEAGTVNAGGAVGLEAAIHYIEQIGFDRIRQREEHERQHAQHVKQKQTAERGAHPVEAARTHLPAEKRHSHQRRDERKRTGRQPDTAQKICHDPCLPSGRSRPGFWHQYSPGRHHIAIVLAYSWLTSS